jgi:S1-C subfamily serine protease
MLQVRPDLTKPDRPPEPVYRWRGARVRELRGEEYSAYGVPREGGGIVLVELSEKALAFRDGFRPGDLIQTVDGRPVPTVANFAAELTRPAATVSREFAVVREQQGVTVRVAGAIEPPRL